MTKIGESGVDERLRNDVDTVSGRCNTALRHVRKTLEGAYPVRDSLGRRVLENSTILGGDGNNVQRYLGFVLRGFKWFEEAGLCVIGTRENGLENLVKRFTFSYHDEASATAVVEECEHITRPRENPGVHFKKYIKDKDDRQNDLVQPCLLCNQVYAFWESFAARFLKTSPYGHSSASSNTSNFSSIDSKPEELARIREDSVFLRWPQGSSGSCDFGVSLDPAQLGEAYHALICALIARHTDDIKFKIHIKNVKPTKEEDQGDMQENAVEVDDSKSTEICGDAADIAQRKQKARDMRALFEWYRIRPRSKPSAETRDSKKDATEVIAAFFRALNEPRITMTQADHFEIIRDSLDVPLTEKYTDATGKVHEKYFQPTYAAKYWINRYLSLTGQGSGKQKLPKSDVVSRLAVIQIRGDSAQSSVGREMDNEMLAYVARSIAIANSTAGEDEMRFSHIILYGDFDFAEAKSRRKIVEDAIREVEEASKQNGQRNPVTSAKKLQKIAAKAAKTAKKAARAATGIGKEKVQEQASGNDIEILYISRPWEAKKAATEGQKIVKDDVAKFWDDFRDFEFDHLPVQVKVLAIWNTLCQRYHPNMCIIGHRSGFIEGAACLGIPVFYLNSERKDFVKQHHSPGQYLWGTIENPTHDRLRELADVVDTFIPIEALQSERTKTIVKKGREPYEIYEVDESNQSDLAAALYMFMCGDMGTELFGFCKRHAGFLEQIFPHDTAPDSLPAWTARVALMHDMSSAQETNQKDSRDAKHRNDADQTGQEWLRQRFLAASAVSDALLPRLPKGKKYQ